MSLLIECSELFKKKMLINDGMNFQCAGDIQQMISLLQIPKTHKMLARGVSLFPENDNDSFNFVGDHDMLGKFFIVVLFSS